MPLTTSIKFRLPLLIVALFGAIVMGFGWSAHRHLTKAFERAAGTRLERASDQLAGLLTQSVTALLADVKKVSTDPVIARAITHPDSASIGAARQALTSKTAAVSQLATRNLWSRDCSLIVSVSDAGPRAAPVGCPASPARARTLLRPSGDVSWMQPFMPHGDSVSYETVTPIVLAGKDTIGYLDEIRLLRSGATIKLIEGLIGKDVQVMLGNVSGNLWSDMSVQVQGPSRLPAADSGWMRFPDPKGVTQIGVSRHIPRTPWMVLVQLPRADVVAPETETMRELGLMALVCLLIGVAGSWMVSRHVTAPLGELTRVAEEMAHGDYTRRVAGDRADELGRLVASFNKMARQVDESTEEMKTQALELELQAEESQDLAHELEISNQELSEALEEATSARRDTTVAERLLDEVLVQAPVGIAVFDREMRYVRLNQAVADIHGVPIEAHLGKRPGEVLRTLGDMKEPLLERVLRTGERVLDQVLSGTLQGTTKRHWLASCFPIRGPSGEVTGVGAILVDNTAQHELEAQFLQAQKMEAVGRLAGGIAHDFNNLLTVITSYSSLALGSLRTDDPLFEDMGEIRSAAERAARLTKQLLAFSRKQVMRPQRIDLSQLAMEMERMLQRLIGEDVTLEMELEPELGDISADPGQIEQVIMNLVVNARDAMPSGGRVVIQTSSVDFASELSMTELGRPAGQYVVLTVTDTGTGMSEETQANLFEPFFTTKGLGLGTGLGLSTVYGIVKQSGGDIHVRSEIGRGTTFKIYLPRLPGNGARPSDQAPATVTSQGGSERILLVEDDEPLRNLAARVLRDAGYTVLDTRTPTEAVLTGTHFGGSIELLLTDVVMPEMSGRTVAELLTQQRPGLSVLYMSGYTDDDVLRRGVLATETEFLQKPFTPEQLLHHVRRALDARRAMRVA
jgi:signal transduction histidine kinase/CheY-like chemotaxis protein